MNRNEVETLARELMNQHGLRTWRLSFARSLSWAGRCWRSKKLIELSLDYMEVYGYADARNVILHEIAHALDTTRYRTITLKNGRKKKQQLHHDEVWKTIARRIGCTGDRCVDPKAPRPLKEQNARYKGICPNGHTTQRTRLGDRIKTGLSCAKCHNVYDPKYRFDWYDNGVLIHTQPKATVTVRPTPQPVLTRPKAVASSKPAPKPSRPIDEFYWTDTPEGIAALKSLLS